MKGAIGEGSQRWEQIINHGIIYLFSIILLVKVIHVSSIINRKKKGPVVEKIMNLSHCFTHQETLEDH